MRRTTDQRYSDVAIFLHWVIAACILSNLIVGFFMEAMPRGQSKHVIVSIHASVGLTVLTLSVARIAWRLGHRAPPLDAALNRLERLLAEAVHGGLYLLMIAMPLAGWATSSASTRKVAGAALFLLTPLPKLWFLVALPTPEKIAAHDQAVMLHSIGAWLFVALLVAHVAGALKHQFIDRRPQFARIWFAASKPGA